MGDQAAAGIVVDAVAGPHDGDGEMLTLALRSAVGNSTGGGGDGDHHATSAILFISFSLLLGVVCRALTKRLAGSLPYTVALLICGILWGIMDLHTTSELGAAANSVAQIDPHLFIQIFLPLLIFESAFSLKWHVFKRLLPQMLVLAVVGVVIAASLTATVLRGVIEPLWSWESCFMLGAIVSATDPVAVVALLKQLGGSAKLRTLIEGESLLNDGTAIVIFSVFVDLSSGVELGVGDAAITFLRLAFGGIGLGVIWGLVTIWVIGLVHQDVLVETTLTIASTYLLFHVAEDFCHVSGVLAIVVLGASFVWYGNTRISPAVAHTLHEFWSILAYMGETVVFVLAGILISQRVGFHTFSAMDYGKLILLYVFLEVIRGAMVLLLSPILTKTGYGIGFRRGLVLVHGGLRGAVSLALAMLVELETEIDESVRNYVLFYGSGITFLTLVVNAPTTGPLVRWLGLLKTTRAEDEKFVGGVETLKESISAEVDKLVQKSPTDVQTLCNWGQIQQYLALDEFIRPVMLTDRRASAIEMVEHQRAAQNTLNGGDEARVAIGDDYLLVFPDDEEDEVRGCCSCIRGGGCRSTPTQPQFSNHELRMQQARLRFLKGTVTIYKKMAKEGRISSDSLKALLDAEEAAEDRCHKPLSEWTESLGFVARNPRWLSYLMKHSTGVGPLRRVLSWGIRNSLARGVSVATAYVEAHRQMLSSSRFDTRTMEQLRRESQGNTMIAKEFLEKASRKYPDLVTQIYSEHAARSLLYVMDKHIAELSAKGVFLDGEATKLHRFVEKKQVLLLSHQEAFLPPTERDVLLSSQLFLGVHEGVCNSLLFQHEEIALKPGEALIPRTAAAILHETSPADDNDDDDDDAESSDGMDNLYFILTGALVYDLPSGAGEQRIDKGGFINAARLLRQRKSAPSITYTALNPTRLLTFPGRAIRELLQNGAIGLREAEAELSVSGVDHFTANLAKLAAAEVLYLYGNDMFQQAASVDLNVLASSTMRTFGNVAANVKTAKVIIAHRASAPFEVRVFGLVLMGTLVAKEAPSSPGETPTGQADAIVEVEGWQVCKPGVYKAASDAALVVSFA